MRILITGASGFVGARTCSHLETAGHEVVRVSHSNRPDGPAYVVDVGDEVTFAALDSVGKVDAIVHCAGIAHRFGDISKDEFWRVNVNGSKNVAEFAARKQVSRFVHLSSVLVYGLTKSREPITEHQPPHPGDDYSSSKLVGEKVVAEICNAAGINLAILRPVPIIGEGSRGNVYRLIRAIDRKRFIWVGDGRNTRSFVYVSDVAEAILTALSIPEDFASFNVTGGTISVREMVEDISKHLETKVPIKLIPHNVAALALSATGKVARLPEIGRYHRTLETWLSNAVYSGQALAAKGFVPATGVREALRREVDFYLAAENK